MASYTDKAPTFNPYVAQQPVEAMLKVGMEKQKQYQQGYEKIQSSIDRVAGLDLYRDVDKNYMQEKLNTLGKKLRTVAAGDFSNFQLTNSVAGMATSIANDKIVQAGVSSTAKIKSEAVRRKALEKEGKTDANNDMYYAKDLDAYLNNPALTGEDGDPIMFNASYIPYTNIIAKMKEALAGAGEDESIAEQIFITDSSGNPKIGRDGNFMYADAKTVEKLTTNKAAVMGALNTVFQQGDVKQQLQVDGWANYRNVPIEYFTEPLRTSYEQSKTRLESLSIETLALSNASNLSQEQRDEAKKTLTVLSGQIVSNDVEYAALLSSMTSNPEAFKQSFYEKQYKESIQNIYTKTKSSKTTETNPALQQQNWRQDFAFKEAVQRTTEAQQNAMIGISQSRLAMDIEKFKADYPKDEATGSRYNANTRASAEAKAAKKGEPINPNKLGVVGDIPGDRPNPSMIYDNTIDKLSTSKKEKSLDLYVDLMRQLNKDPNMSKTRIINSVEQYAKASNITPEQYLDRWANNIQNKYDELGLTAPPSLRDDIISYNNTATTLNNKVNLKTRLGNETLKELGDENNEFLKINKTRPGLNINLGVFGGNNQSSVLHLKPTDIVGLIHYNKEKRTSTGQQLRANMSAQQLKYLELKENGRIPYALGKKLDDGFRGYQNEYEKHSKVLSKYNDIYNKRLEDVIPFTSTKSFAVDMSKLEIAKERLSEIDSYVSSADQISLEEGTDREKLRKALTEPGKVKVSWQGNVPTMEGEKWTGKITINTGDDNPVILNNLPQELLEILGGKELGAYKNTPIQDQINVNRSTKTTNPIHFPGDPDAWKTAYYKNTIYSEDIKNNGYIYRADVAPTAGGYRPIHYVKTSNSKSFVPIYGDKTYPDEQILNDLIKTITPAEVESLYLNQLQKQKK